MRLADGQTRGAREPIAPDAVAFATAEDRAICRERIRTGSRSFHAASLLLPACVRDGAYALYAFCRLSDDAVDDACDSGAARGAAQRAAIARLIARLDAAYAGRPADDPADRCLADAVRAFGVPRAAFDALIDGFVWDAQARRHDTLADVEAYAERVAGSVGAMMAALMDVRDPAMVDRACDLGLAMQLTNIARDVGEDARAGRLYLPRLWLVEAGIDPDAFLAEPAFTPALGGVVERLLARADALYARADEAIARLPATMRPAIHAARLLYAEIGAVARRRGCDTVGRRASTSAGRKAWLVGRAVQLASRPAPAAALEAGRAMERPLVAAVVAAPGPRPPPMRPGPDDDVEWVIELFASLERRDRGIARA